MKKIMLLVVSVVLISCGNVLVPGNDDFISRYESVEKGSAYSDAAQPSGEVSSQRYYASGDWRSLVKFDPRNSSYPKAKNQDVANNNTCWAFASIGVFESALYMQTGRSVDLSEQQLISEFHPYLKNINQKGAYYWGNQIYRVIKQKGIVLEEKLPYTGFDPNNRKELDGNLSGSDFYRVADFVNMYTVDRTKAALSSDAYVDSLKAAIYKYGAVACMVDSSGEFHNNPLNYSNVEMLN